MNEPRIRVEGIGPILQADIALRPLTIFIGPNNVGKSYTSVVIHALKNALLDAVRTFRVQFFEKMKQEEREDAWPLSFERIMNKLEESLMENEQQQRLWSLCSQFLKTQMEHNFSARINELVNVDFDRLKLSIWNKRLEGYIELGRDETIECGCKIRVTKRQKRVKLDYFLVEPTPSFLLPAARSGILQAHKTIAAVITSLSPLLPIRRIEIPRLSGVAANFVSQLLTITEARWFSIMDYITWRSVVLRRRRLEKPLSRILQFMEEELLKGRIVLKAPSKKLAPDIYYRSGDLLLPIHRASSMVSELAPIYLYLKYILPVPSYLIIEEPESHLHPEAQRHMARLLVRLVNAGVHVLVTTHSDYLLSQLNIHLLLSAKTREEVRKAGFDEDDRLEPDKIGVYLFKFSDGGSIAEELQVTEEGIPDYEFSKVAEAIHGIYTKLFYHRLFKK